MLELKTIGVLAAMFAIAMLLLFAVLPTRNEPPHAYERIPQPAADPTHG